MDASGLTFNSFEKWNPAQAVDTSQEPAPMIITSSQLAGVDDQIGPPAATDIVTVT